MNQRKRIIDITGVELMPGEPDVCLGNGDQDLNVVATGAITFCFVSPNMI